MYNGCNYIKIELYVINILTLKNIYYSKMKTKQIGVWMDHASAHLIVLKSDKMETKIIESEFTNEEKKDTLIKGEKAMHHKENHEQLAYYKTIAAEIKKYEEVLLFGPTSAKAELVNFLKSDHHFDKIDIETRQTDKMTENQQHAFVKKYFLSHLSKVSEI